MMVSFSSAPSLLLGLSARLFVDKFITQHQPTMKDFGLLGLWQGVGVYYAFTINQDLAIAAIVLVGTRLVVEFSSEHDFARFTSTVLGAALGVIVTDVLSRFLGDGLYRTHKPRTLPVKSPNAPLDRKRRVVQFERAVNSAADGSSSHRRRSPIPTQSDITSLDTTSDMGILSSSLSPLEKEVARLRARASPPDTERRRYKEEGERGVSQGNHARASQMAWEVKRYKSLMQSFHREADALLVQCEICHVQTSLRYSSVRCVANTRQDVTDIQRPTPPDQSSQHKPPDTAAERQPVSNGDAGTLRKQKSGR